MAKDKNIFIFSRDENQKIAEEMLSDNMTAFDFQRGQEALLPPSQASNTMPSADKPQIEGYFCPPEKAKFKTSSEQNKKQLLQQPATPLTTTTAKDKRALLSAERLAKIAQALNSPLPDKKTKVPKRAMKGHSFFHHLLQIFCILFVLVWVFILGILVGRGGLWQSLPFQQAILWIEGKVHLNPPKVELAQNVEIPTNEPGPLPSSEPSSLPEEAMISPANLPTAYYSQNPESLAELERQAQEKAQAEAAKPSNSSAVPLPPPLATPEPDVAASTEPAVLPPSTIPPPPQVALENSARIGRFAVQTASPKSEVEAIAMQNKLEEQGFLVYYYQTQAGHFPVRVGPYATKSEADAARQKLIQFGYSDPYISTLSEGIPLE